MKTFIIQSEKLFEGRLIATQPRKDLKVLVYLNGVVVGKYIKNRVTFAIHTKKSHGNLRGHLAMKHGVFEDNNVKCFCYLVEAKTVCKNLILWRYLKNVKDVFMKPKFEASW